MFKTMLQSRLARLQADLDKLFAAERENGRQWNAATYAEAGQTRLRYLAKIAHCQSILSRRYGVTV